MGHESFIDWISPEIALAYFLAVTVVLIGVLQLAAIRWDRPELRWLRSRRRGALFGLALIAAGTGAFYGGMQELIFVPGLAGAELFVLFGAGTVTAIIVVRLVAWALSRRAGRPAPATTVPLTSPSVASTPSTAVQSAVHPDGNSLPDDAAWVVPPREGKTPSHAPHNAKSP